jgi:outer membrane protein OmpA-like peptidoglycan-associated protein
MNIVKRIKKGQNMRLISRFLVIVGIIVMSGVTVQAQFGERLGKAIKKSAEDAAVRKAEQKTDQAVSKGVDKATDPNSYKGEKKEENKNNSKNNSSKGNNNQSDEDETPTPTSKGNASKDGEPQGTKTLEMAYAKSDFVPGDEIIFDDDFANEKLGEFPSQWDLVNGNAEVVSVAGKKGVEITSYTDGICPLMKTPKNYLGDVFTLEYDFLIVKPADYTNLWVHVSFWKPDERSGGYPNMEINYSAGLERDKRFHYEWIANENTGSGDVQLDWKHDTWNHVAISFNKRAWKVYVNGVRYVNVPNVATPPGWVHFHGGNPGEANVVFTNVRIAKGAVPLYDRMVSDGKIISYGITFDVGKSTIKPESMGEINRIATLMKENPDLKFSVEGHTDNTGTAPNNQTLSESRSQAVMDKLVEMGIAKDRLKAAGKGQTSPIADNSTDEGRAKNRRVEFVKIK